MAKTTRTDALSKDRIVEAAIEILDAEGESALTFRALAARLSTGAGAIYWHVADKDALLAATTQAVIARAMALAESGDEPRKAIRLLALGIFDEIDAHPWVGTELSRQPWQTAMLQICERVGGQLMALAVPERALFNAATALVTFILGAAGQNAANARQAPPETDRAAALAKFAAEWASLDPAEHPFLRHAAKAFAEHDDREQFLAGVDLILVGVAALR